MSKLNIDRETIKELFGNNKINFLIPDYQRPYAWEEKECQTLWDDLRSFAFPDNNCDNFNSDNQEYFLGSIVMFKNDEKKMEIIDGQQRITTLMLLLRAFYEKYGKMQNDKAIRTAKIIGQCIWKTDEYEEADKNVLKINSEVATESDREEFINILKTGETTANEDSNYANNYRFFQNKITEFLNAYPDWFSLFPLRIMNNCILLPIEAESQDTALCIFSTLNNRGKPLSDSDIFKAQFYKFFTGLNKKDEFIAKWKELEATCISVFRSQSGSAIDEIFSRYMYCERAKAGITSSTTEGLRKFYQKNDYALLKSEETFNNLIDLANFWRDVAIQNQDRFSDRVLKKFFVLNYSPNSMWTYIVSVYYMSNRDDNGSIDDEKFFNFLDKIIAFTLAYSMTNPGINALRTPIFAEMINIVTDKPVTFGRYIFTPNKLKTTLNDYMFGNTRPITKSILTWWAFQNQNQQLLPLETDLEIEHIYSHRRENKLSTSKNMESLGNKSILEKRVNIRASDYKFSDKVKYYKGQETRNGQKKEGTKIQELLDLADTCDDFNEIDIVKRKAEIVQSFINYVKDNTTAY
ncbi:MAG: DUF262 domain-containing protein [Selenomonadaceae bacterium]|nr:DUF262 domain-containing protein [Selenomonadaceae bacterium]